MFITETPLDGNSVLIFPNSQVKFGACINCDSHRAADSEEIPSRFIAQLQSDTGVPNSAKLSVVGSYSINE